MKIYLKQALAQYRENKLYAVLYIIGTILSMTLIMMLVMAFYVKIGPVYPETNRNRILFVKACELANKSGYSVYKGRVSSKLVTPILLPLKSAEAISCYGWTNREAEGVMEGKDEVVKHAVATVDENYWKAFSFEFLKGRPFQKEDIENSEKVCIISDEAAEKFFGNIDVLGRTIVYSIGRYKIIGVVRAPYKASVNAYSEVWKPFTYDDKFGQNSSYRVAILAKSRSQFPAILQEIKENITVEERRLIVEEDQKEPKLSFAYYPTDRFHEIMEVAMDDTSYWKQLLPFIFFGVIVLLLPSMNLATMNASRMEKRLTEIAIRRAFGATKIDIYRQIFIENLLLTIVGTLLGIVIAYVSMSEFGYWIVDLIGNERGERNLDMEMSFAFNPFVLSAAFLFCFVVNLLASLVPSRILTPHVKL